MGVGDIWSTMGERYQTTQGMGNEIIQVYKPIPCLKPKSRPKVIYQNYSTFTI